MKFTLRGATGVTIQPHQILRLPRKMTLMIDTRHTWNVIITLRGPTDLTVQRHQILPCQGKMAFQKKKKTWWKRTKRHLQWGTIRAWSKHDPNMIRPQSEPTRHLAPARSPRLLFALRRRILYWELQRFALRLFTQILPNTTPATKSDTATSPNIAPATKSDTARLPNIVPATKVTHQHHQIMRLPGKVTHQHHQMLRLPRIFWCEWWEWCEWGVDRCDLSDVWLSYSTLSYSTRSYWATELLYWTVPGLNCSLTELLLDWTVPWLNGSLTELLLDWTVTWLNWTVTFLNCYLLHWTVTLLNCYFKRLLLFWTLCIFNLRNSEGAEACKTAHRATGWLPTAQPIYGEYNILVKLCGNTT